MNKVPINDLYVAAFLLLHSIEPELTIVGTRVIFEFPANESIYRLLRQYECNPDIKALDFSQAIRRLRGRMLAERPPRQA